MISKKQALVALSGGAFALTLVGLAPNFERFWFRDPASSADPTGAERAKNLAAQIEGGYRLDGVEITPEVSTCNFIQYKLDHEVRLSPGETIYFAMPDAIKANPVVYMVIGHRQDPRTQRGNPDKASGRDNYPGLTLAGVWSEAKSEWRSPKGEWSSGGKVPAKFAEVKSNPEKDAIFDIGKLGSVRSADGGDKSRDPLYPSTVRLLSMGKDPVFVSELTVRTYPGDSSIDDVQVFSPGTVFSANSFAMPDVRYGGGDNNRGTYPRALQITPRHRSRARLPDGWKDESGQIAIPVRAGKVLREVLAKVGDAHPDGVKNDDGHYGSHGAAKFSIAIRHADGSETVLMDKENVGPQATFRAAPAECEYVAKAGDDIILRSDAGRSGRGGDTAYVMGVKIRYAEAAAAPAL